MNNYFKILALWERPETLLLFDLHKKYEKYKLKNRTEFWQKIYAGMVKKNTKKTIKQCQTRLETLRKKYLREKDRRGPNGSGLGARDPPMEYWNVSFYEPF